MSETAMRRRVINALKQLDAISVENSVHPGTPDVNCVGAWIELKQLAGWTKDGHLPAMPHYRKEQRIWLRRRWRAGGVALFLLQIGPEWLLLDGATASYLERGYPQEVVRKAAIRCWPKGIVDTELVECIMKLRRSRARSTPT